MSLNLETTAHSAQGSQTPSIRCNAKYLCQMPDGQEFCRIVNGDYHACPHYDIQDVMIIPPNEVRCDNKCKCKYAGKRNNCDTIEGHNACGVIANGNIPGGEVPDKLLEKIVRVIPSCSV